MNAMKGAIRMIIGGQRHGRCPPMTNAESKEESVKRAILVMFTLMLLFSSIAHAGDYIRLNVSSVEANTPDFELPFHIERTCSEPEKIMAAYNAFGMWATGDASWVWKGFDPADVCMEWWNLGGLLLTAADVDGVPPDHFVTAGTGMPPAGGLPMVSDQLYFTVTLDIGAKTGEICIDSSFIPYGGVWNWEGLTCGVGEDGDRPYFVDVDGNDDTHPICITVEEASCIPPTITDKPPVYWPVSHCDVAIFDFNADPGFSHGSPAEIAGWELLYGSLGAIDFSTGEYTLDCAYYAGAYNVTVRVTNSCGETDDYSFTVECTDVYPHISNCADAPREVVCEDYAEHRYVFDFAVEDDYCDIPNLTWYAIPAITWPPGGTPFYAPHIDETGLFSWNIDCYWDVGQTFFFQIWVEDDFGRIDECFMGVEVHAFEPDFYIRDCEDDPGAQITTGMCDGPYGWWASPDIYFDKEGDGIMDLPWAELPNRLYFIVRNRSDPIMPVPSVTLDAYFTDAASGVRFPIEPDPATHIHLGQLVYDYIEPGTSDRNYLLWHIPESPDYSYYCVGAVLNADGDLQWSGNVDRDNNVAQANIWTFRGDIPAPGEKGPPDSTVFDAVFKGCNPEPYTVSCWPVLDTESQGGLPSGWYASLDDEGPFSLAEDSCVDIHLRVRAYDPQHNDTAVISVVWMQAGNPPHVLGGGVYSFGIDDYPAVTVHDLQANCVSCGETDADSCAWVRLDWTRPLYDLVGEAEHLLGFFVYSDTEPGVDTSDIFDSTAIDWNLDIPRWQWYDYRAPTDVETRYYRVAAVDAARNVSELSNEISITIGEPVDADCSGRVDIDDVVYMINHILVGGPEPKPMPCVGDANADGALDIDDVVHLILYIFAEGDPPVPSCW